MRWITFRLLVSLVRYHASAAIGELLERLRSFGAEFAKRTRWGPDSGGF
jgi:hypothetical protein